MEMGLSAKRTTEGTLDKENPNSVSITHLSNLVELSYLVLLTDSEVTGWGAIAPPSTPLGPPIPKAYSKDTMPTYPSLKRRR
ncbi:hypothetical protein CHARACLAT_011581 [Characodon lateralis]|uniref:Uncharacterized protein n=1 Tax=Characodon lateralis TaxID=208331 RepID=A0ABU7DZP7_9TELE|nr:hypothetical protein [Characodon lateralis]